MKQLRNILFLLVVIVGLPMISSCNDDDDIDYTEYYDWRDENNRVTELFAMAVKDDSLQTYFNHYALDLKEPNSYPTFFHYFRRANLDSLRNLSPRKDYRPYSTSSVSVHYTLFNTDSLYACVKRQGGWTIDYLRNGGGKVDSLFFANLEDSPLKADTIESYQVQFYKDFTPNSVINGWGTLLQNMYIGDNVVCMIPWFLAYGQAGSGKNIPPYTNLFFRIELCDITNLGSSVK